MAEPVDQGHDSAGSENTGGENATPPEIDVAKERQTWVARGIQEGHKRTLQKLGLGDDLDAALESLEQLRAAQAGEQEGQDGGANVADSEEFRTLAKEHLAASKELDSLRKQNERLTKQADEARVEKLRAAAMAKGVGPGQQVEAFVRLFGDRVKFNDERSLEVISDFDGSRVSGVVSLEDFLDETLKEHEFLLAPRQEPAGANSRTEPTTETPKNDLGLLAALRGEAG